MALNTIKRLVDSEQVSGTGGQTIILDLPRSHFLAAIVLRLNIALNGAGITIVDPALGAIRLIRRVQLILDGHAIPLSISGEFLHYWGFFDRPGSEPFALSSIVDGARWPAVLRYPLAQTDVHLDGSPNLADYTSARVEIELDDVAEIAGGAPTLSGSIDLFAELVVDGSAVAANIRTDTIHTLTSIPHEISQSGEVQLDLPRGRQLLRLLAIAEDNAGAYSWDVVNHITFQYGNGDEPLSYPTDIFRAEQLRRYGGDAIPIPGVYAYDFRHAGPRDVVPLGHAQIAPQPRLILDVDSAAVLPASIHFVLEQQSRIRAAAAPGA